MEPQLTLVIHTEEEFDWDGGFHSQNTAASHAPVLAQWVKKLVANGFPVTLAVDYPFTVSKPGQQALHSLIQIPHSQLEIAAHLHPWVSPPFRHEHSVAEQDTYPGNLPYEEEKAKLEQLTRTISEVTGYVPTTYLAGRYGIGENTHQVLSELGYKTDLSVSPFCDFSHQSGPDFSGYCTRSFWDDRYGIASHPHTVGLVSWLAPLATWLNGNPERYRQLGGDFAGRALLKLAGVKRWRLSPEGFTLKQMQRLTLQLLAGGQQTFVLSFHSPSVVPGFTPYVRNAEELTRFTTDTEAYLAWFRDTLKGSCRVAGELHPDTYVPPKPFQVSGTEV
ncbi:hypothetical protein NF212_18020 [Parasalinivibrio latis]|uniref:hypothetical protein n=1 Tax=Parasalinivibrio latis TaxID=2952610 RepID=UPI0030E29BE0